MRFPGNSEGENGGRLRDGGKAEETCNVCAGGLASLATFFLPFLPLI